MPNPAPKKAAPSRLRRPLQRMPAFVRRALEEQGLLPRYRERPAYQRNDYLAWIGGAKRSETRQKRLAQMLTELAGGSRYMNMAWRPRARAAGPAGSGRVAPRQRSRSPEA